MNQRNITVSVIMACHHASAYLDEAVSSVLSQTLGDLEVILIDDGSTDNTLDIAKHYQKQDDRVLVLSLPVNAGPAMARNAGIQVARGVWLGILDSDDVAMPSRFEEQIRLANSDKDLVMIGSNAISMDGKGHAIKEHKYPIRHGPLVKRLACMRPFPPHSSMIYKKDVVVRLSAFNVRYVQCEDYDLWLRLSEVGKVASVGKSLVKIRKHERNISYVEGGRLQIRLWFAATVCHFMRTQGCPDPLTTHDGAKWLEFVTWIDKQLIKESAYERYKSWSEARTEYFATENRWIRMLRFGTRLLQSGHAGSLVWEKVFGSSLPKRLAREWRVWSG